MSWGRATGAHGPVDVLPGPTDGPDAYRGQDRRGILVSDHRWPGPAFPVGLAVLVLVFLVSVLAPAWVPASDTAPPLLAVQFDAAAWAFALLLAGLCVVRYRLLGEAGFLWLAVAVGLYGALTLGVGQVMALSQATGNEYILWLHPASGLVVLGLAALGMLSPEVDTTLRPMRLVLMAVALTAVGALVLRLVPQASSVVADPRGLGPFASAFAPRATVMVVAVWGVLAIWALWRGLRHRRHVFAWFGLLFLALALADVLRLLPDPRDSLWVAGSSFVQVIGLMCAVAGTVNEFVRAYVRQGGRLLESLTSERTAEARVEAELATQAERAHEARNALAAIDGAVQTLQLYQDRMDEETRAELSAAVSGEVQRLQQLVSVEAEPRRPGRFRITEVLAAVVTAARSQGMSVSLDVPDHLVAIGQPGDTAQVLHNLFQNARRYAGDEIHVRASLEDERVVVRVEDDGPGIEPEETQRIFARGVRGRASEMAPGSGLGLYVSARLMGEQSGEIRVENRVEGGACFAIVLPGFSELPTGEPLLEDVLEELDEDADLVADRKIALVPPPGEGQPGSGGVEHEDGVRDDLAL